MTVELRHSALMGRAVRSEAWPEQGVSSLKVARDALKSAPIDEAIALVDNYAWEERFVAFSYVPWLTFNLTDGMARFGGVDVWRMLSQVSTHLATVGTSTLALEVVEGLAQQYGDVFELRDGCVVYLPTGESLATMAWKPPLDAILDQLRAAIGNGQRDTARDLLETYHQAGKPFHDGFCDWAWLWMTLVADTHGEDVMFEQFRVIGMLLRGEGLKRQANLPIEELVLQMAMAMRGHRCGPGEEGDIEVIDEDDRYIIRFDACGSGGRMRRRGLDGLPARQDPPFNFGTNKKPVPESWGLTDVPYYCSHCAQWSEMMTTDILGYPARITLFDPDGTRPCAWAIYKKPEDIPQEYFDRIGRERRPERFNKVDTDQG